MKQSTKETIKGHARELKGQLKERGGRAADRPDIQQQGRSEGLRGKARRKVSEVKRVFEE